MSVSVDGCLSFFVGPVISLQLVQGIAHLRPKRAGMGPSTPATSRVQDKRWWKIDGWMNIEYLAQKYSKVIRTLTSNKSLHLFLTKVLTFVKKM